MSTRKYPKHWTDIPWQDFPTMVTWGKISLNPEQFLYTFFDDDHDSKLYPKYHDELVDIFNWDYLHHPDMYMGKQVSLGVYYGYPKCCIFEFAFGNLQHRHPQAMAYVRYAKQQKQDKNWVLCHACADYVAAHGMDAYLANKAWERE